jgi:sulfur-carrier protein adenylyltransferase/sulfurtransferase
MQLPAALREYTAGAAEIEVSAADVHGALEELTRRFPVLRRHLFDDAGELRGYVRVYLNADDIGSLHRQGATPIHSGDTIMIVPSIAGGTTSGTEEDNPGADPTAHSGTGDNAARADTARIAASFSAEEITRYARHITLPDVGWAGQQRLRNARVAIVGAGGLGSPVSLYLAAAGVGTLGLIDFDVVEPSNLQRQVIYGTSDVGTPKVAAAARRLRDVNPHVRVLEHETRLTSANALDVLRDYDVIIDGTDNFPTRYLVNDACVLLGKPYVYGSILRFEGQVSVFDARHGPCYRCLFREPPPPGLVPSCAEGGVLGVLPGIIGSLQALEAIKLITGAGETLMGRLVLFDALTFRWRELRLRRNSDCAVCGENPTVTALIDYNEFCAPGATTMDTPQQQSQPVPQITPAELKQRLDAGEALNLIDVREPFEWDMVNLSQYGARLIPLDQVVERRHEIDPAAETIIYCRSGSRSAGAVRQLRAHGYDRLTNLKGGIKSWAEDVDPSMPTY